MLLLADIAAEHNMPIVLHTEAVPQDMALPAPLKSPPNPPRLHANIAALGRLAAHNPRAKIIWAHAGSDNTGYRTPEICRTMLMAHPNVYMEIKIDPVSPGKNPASRKRQDQARVAQALSGVSRPLPYRQRPALSRSQRPAALGRPPWSCSINSLPSLRKKIGMENPLRIYG